MRSCRPCFWRLFISLLVTCWLFPSCDLSAQNPGEWGSLPDIPDAVGLGGPLVGTHNGVLIVAGGANFPTPLAEGGKKVWHDKIYVLMPGAASWRTLAVSLPRGLAYSATASHPDGVVVIGGSNAESVCSEAFLIFWDDEAQSVRFDALPELPTKSAFGAAEVIGDRIYVLAGKMSKDDVSLHGGIFVLDLTDPDRGWQSLPALPENPLRYKMVTAVQKNAEGEECLYVFSGSRTERKVSGDLVFSMFTDCYCFVPSDKAWARIAPMPVLDDPREIPGKEVHAMSRWPINAACAIGYGEDRILTFSGSTGRYITDKNGKIIPAPNRYAFPRRVLSYDTKNDRWGAAGEMPVGVVTTRAVTWEGMVVIPSGETRPGIRTPAVQTLPLPERSGLVVAAGSVGFRTLDYVVLGFYLFIMVAVGIYFARRETTTEEFFLGGRRIPWWAAGLSIFGTQLSAITFMAIPATAYGSDWRRFVGSFMLLPVFVLVIYAFLPLFRRLNITTAYEYLEARFSLSLRLFASALFIVFQLGRMGIVLLLPAIALSAVTGMDTYTCIMLMGLMATIYTALGGISAVIWTDVLQVIVLIGGALLCLIVAVMDSGGLGATLDAATAAGKLQMLDWSWGVSDMVAWVLFVGFLFTNLVPYTTDQTVIQRYLATRDESQAAKSMWLNLVITLPTGLLFFGLGTALYVYYSKHPSELAQVPEKTDQLVPWFVVSHLPSGVAGLIVAGIFAAAMSSLDSSMNSVTTAVVNDWVVRLRKDGRERNFFRLARVLTLVLGLVGTIIATTMATFEIKYMFDFFQKVLGLFGGGLSGVFLLAVFSRTANAKGALIGLIAGGALTVTVAYATTVNFLLYAAVGALTCVLVGHVVSRVTGGADQDLAGLTYATRNTEAKL